MKKSSNESAKPSPKSERSDLVPRFKTEGERSKFRDSLLADLGDYVKSGAYRPKSGTPEGER